MGRRGPAPKPTALKIAEGNPGHRPLNTREANPTGTPERPDWVEGVAIAIWDDLVPRLVEAGLARGIDNYALGQYCCLFEEWLRAKAAIRKATTYPVKDAEGNVIAIRELPQAGAFRKLGGMLRALEREFGLTPAARTRIHAEHEKVAAESVDELRRQFFAAG